MKVTHVLKSDTKEKAKVPKELVKRIEAIAKRKGTNKQRYSQKGGKGMELELIFSGEATLEELYKLHELGFEFVVEGGAITHVYKD